MGLHGWFNAFEAGFWIVCGIGSAVAARTSHNDRGIYQIAAVALVAFGATDIVEIFTGGWHRPVALLAANAACAFTLIYCGVRLRLARKRRVPPTTNIQRETSR